MGNIKLSIIIPVYKVEKFIEKCLKSIFEQDIDLDNYEVIVVNDGTPDKSMDIVHMFAEDYDNLHILNQENKGLSVARNNGFKIARGEYIWFIDSDDWIKENSLGKIYGLLKNKNVEVLAFNIFIATDEDTRICGNERKLKNGNFYDGPTLFKKGFVYPFSGAQFYIYNHHFLKKNKMFFKEGVYFEDLLFTAKIFTILERCLFVSESFYYYYMRNGSITQSKSSPKKVKDLLKISQSLFDLLPYTQKYRKIIIYSIIAKITKAFYTKWKELEDNERKELRKRFLKMNIWMYSITKSLKLKYILLYILIYYNI